MGFVCSVWVRYYALYPASEGRRGGCAVLAGRDSDEPILPQQSTGCVEAEQTFSCPNKGEYGCLNAHEAAATCGEAGPHPPVLEMQWARHGKVTVWAV